MSFRLADAVALHRSGRLAEAVACYQSIARIEGPNGELLRLLGSAQAQLGQPASAIASFREALAQEPGHLGSLTGLAQVLLATGDYWAAVEVLEQASHRAPRNPAILMNLAAAQHSRGAYDRAIETYLRLANILPNHSLVQSNLGIAYFNSGDHEAAIAACRRAIQLDPGNSDGHGVLGLSLLTRRQWAEAVAALGEAHRINPADQRISLNLALACHEAGELGRAEEVLRAFLAAHPAHSQACFSLSDLLLDAGRVEEALDLCRGFLRARPRDSRIIAMLGVLLAETGQLAEWHELYDFGRLVRDFHLDEVGPADGAFLTGLVAEIMRDPSLSYEPTQFATVGGSHTGYLSKSPTPAMRSLLQAVNSRVAAYAGAARPLVGSHPFLGSVPDRWQLYCWSVVMEPGGHQKPHIHPEAWLSGVFYPELPASIAANDPLRQGWLEFGRPATTLHARGDHPTHAVCPHVGLLILFPSFMYHATIPLRAGARRISIAFDIVADWGDGGRPGRTG